MRAVFYATLVREPFCSGAKLLCVFNYLFFPVNVCLSEDK